jgi:hypothetical protein
MTFLTFACLLAAAATSADDGPKQIPLWPNGAPGFFDPSKPAKGTR